VQFRYFGLMFRFVYIIKKLMISEQIDVEV